MAILELKKFNDPALRRKSVKVENVDGEIKKIVEDMKDTMDINNGVGLAAPQVGINRRIIIVSDLENEKILALINPVIIKKGKEKEKIEEGCLSFPNIYLEIKRPKEVSVKALDENGREVVLNAKGILARILQHEIDHLYGVLFFYHLSFIEKLKFKFKKWD
jgi:peptide deformylase